MKAIEILKQQQLYMNIVADIACGTGISTKQLVDNINYKKLYAVDFSEKLLAVAKKKD